MKLIPDTEDATRDRKTIKSQVEKRRRERMNRSLERLRTILLQEPQQLSGSQRRVEKTEILERTVLFLQNTGKVERAGGGGQTRSFQDGFSSCLRRAASFLGPRGEGLRLGAALDASLAGRADCDARPSTSPPHAVLGALRRESAAGWHLGGPAGSAAPGAGRVSEVPPQNRDLRGQAGKESPSQRPDSQSLWRPWP